VSYRELSLWHETCGDDLQPRAGLREDLEVDVAIVGAGFTGLWTAYYLNGLRPDLSVAVIEREVAGFGASGRNGGWASGLFPSSSKRLSGLGGSSPESAKAMMAAMRSSVDEVGRVAAAESIDCDYHKGGTVVVARTDVQLTRARAGVEKAYRWGDTADDIRMLSVEETAEHIRTSRSLGATFTPHCARIHPARLARGLARVVEDRGVRIFERTTATQIAPSSVRTTAGEVRARFVIRATEGFTPALDGMQRTVIPVYSLVVATEPLPAQVWDEIGLSGRPTFSDHRHLVIYGQRSADDRLVFGGRGAPYHFASAVRPSYDREARVFESLRHTLTDLFPVLSSYRFTHEWGGPLAIARDWMASVGLDRTTGIGWAGGYVGDGVSTTNLAGRTLADLITGAESDLVRLPWVNHQSRAWEPEPLRWLEINAGLRAMTAADHEERLTHRPSLLAQAMAPMIGGH
jgi:glycine/D-amino acid oxidase-like deaminating enzyme